MAATPERRERLDFSATLLMSGGALYVRSPDPTPEGLRALAGKTVVTPRTGPLAAFIQNTAPEVKLVVAEDYETSLARLVSGEADAAALNYQTDALLAGRLYPGKLTVPRVMFLELPFNASEHWLLLEFVAEWKFSTNRESVAAAVVFAQNLSANERVGIATDDLVARDHVRGLNALDRTEAVVRVRLGVIAVPWRKIPSIVVGRIGALRNDQRGERDDHAEETEQHRVPRRRQYPRFGVGQRPHLRRAAGSFGQNWDGNGC
jgi:Bacterial extracellular solute-binding proteins, family 3